MSYQLSVVLTYLPAIFFGIVFAIAGFLYLFRNKPIRLLKVISYKLLVISSIAFRIFYAVLLTIVQYYVWSQSEFTKLLINSPNNESPLFNSRLSYFLFYSYGHFWLNVLISIGVAFAFYLFLKFLKKYQERFFEQGEIELGFIMALIIGWPNFVVFIPCVFVFVVLISVFRGLFLKESYTTLGWPLILAALIMLIWGGKLIQILGLGVLKI